MHCIERIFMKQHILEEVSIQRKNESYMRDCWQESRMYVVSSHINYVNLPRVKYLIRMLLCMLPEHTGH